MLDRVYVCLLVALSTPLGFAACKTKAEARHDHAPASLPPAVNPVQSEMRVLHEAARDWVTAVSFNSLDTIPASIEKVHAARAVTEAALEKGTYKPPRNGDQLEEFKRTDEAFHAELVKLVSAASAKDLTQTTHQLGVVLDHCTACHQRFRF